MADIAAIRSALALRIGTVQHHADADQFLRASDLELDSVNPPVALVGVNSFHHDDKDASGGMDLLNFRVTVLASRADVKGGQRALDAYLSTGTATSIEDGIEGDRKLGGTVDRCRVSLEDGSYGFVEWAGEMYLGAVLIVETRVSP